jgi:hypothetical protein
LFSVVLTVHAVVTQPVQTREDQRPFILDNGIVGSTINKQGGMVNSIRCRKDGKDMEFTSGRGMLFDFDNHNRRHVAFGQRAAAVKLIGNSPDVLANLQDWAWNGVVQAPSETWR